MSKVELGVGFSDVHPCKESTAVEQEQESQGQPASW